MAILPESLRTTIAAILLSCCVGWPTHAQGPAAKRAITLIDLAELPRIAGAAPQLSPDGKTLAYLLTRTDWKAGRLIFQLWRQDVGGGAPAQLTFSDGGVQPGALKWSPDGRTLLFLREGQIVLLPLDGGESRVLTRHATSVNTPTWSPDGTTVYFLANDPRTSEERERLRDDLVVVDEGYKHRQLWKIVVSTGAETQVTTGDVTVNYYTLSADGKRLALVRAPSPADMDLFRGEVWVMDAGGENPRVLTHNTIEEKALELSPDGTQVMFLADTNERFEPYYPTNLFIMPAAGGAPRLLLPDFTYAFDQAIWAPDGKSIIASVNMGVHSELFRIDVAARRAHQITDGAHFIPVGWSAVPGAGKLVFQLDQPTRFGDVWTLPMAGDQATPARITRHFDALERDFALPREEKAEWKGADGTPVEGVLFYPSDYRAGQRYPLVVQLHGGPMESDKFGMGAGLTLHYVPVLAAKGYFILRPNYRGSVGYGSAFFRDVVDGYFHQMTSDVMLGVDALIARGLVDQDRLVVMGWSAGGTLVDKLITLTDRFKAASSGAGIANWVSLYGQTDSTAFRRTWFGGTPWRTDAPFDLFWNNSPIKDVAKTKTPTIFIAGDADTRVPMAQSLEMYRALKSLDIPTRLLLGPGEGHQWSGLRHMLMKANIELEWFEKYANQKAYVWEKAPSS
jgi:dipeptidyl aminopeptidase/acylaminoacyl peptidase